MSGKIYRHKSIHVSRSTIPLTTHSWQVRRSIYNSHIDIKFLPHRYGVHREQATLLNAQGHLYKGIRQNMFWDKTQRCRSTFSDFQIFMCFRIFDIKNKKRFIKNNNVKTFKAKANKQTIFNSNKQQHTTKHSHKTLEVLMHGHVVILMHEYLSSPTHHVHLGWYSYRIGYES